MQQEYDPFMFSLSAYRGYSRRLGITYFLLFFVHTTLARLDVVWPYVFFLPNLFFFLSVVFIGLSWLYGVRVYVLHFFMCAIRQLCLKVFRVMGLLGENCNAPLSINISATSIDF